MNTQGCCISCYDVLNVNIVCFQVKCLVLFVTHYPLIAELESLSPAHVSNYHMSYVSIDDSGNHTIMMH